MRKIFQIMLIFSVVIFPFAQSNAAGKKATTKQAATQPDTSAAAKVGAPPTSTIKDTTKGAEMEVKGKFTGKIPEKKSPLHLFFDPFDALAAYIQHGNYVYDKQLKLNSDLASTLYPVLASDEVKKPWLHGIVRDAVSLFNPVYGNDVASWTVYLRDEKGSLFKSWTGEGAPPRNISWDGRGEDGTMLNPGLTYVYSAEAKDALGNQSKVIGRDIVLKGILYKEMGEWIIALRGDRVWDAEGSSGITADGFLLLREAADLIKQLYTRKLEVQVYSRNEVLSRERGQVLMNYFLNNVVVPPYTVTHVSGFVDEVYNSSYIKIIL
jgi:hypothetical protein